MDKQNLEEKCRLLIEYMEETGYSKSYIRRSKHGMR